MTIIEQADEIVGIADEIVACRNYGLSRRVYRRGAYLEWLATQDESRCIDELNKRGSRDHRMGDMPVEKIADAIVAVHAATRLKGDGLPESDRINIRTLEYPTWCAVEVSVRCSKDEADAFVQYLTRCLSAPVRRLMAEYEIVESPTGIGIMSKSGTHYFRHKGENQ